VRRGRSPLDLQSLVVGCSVGVRLMAISGDGSTSAIPRVLDGDVRLMPDLQLRDPSSDDGKSGGVAPWGRAE
jgi:hypothetical protein